MRTELLGDRTWWMPAWLDRLVPHLDVEGDGIERKRTGEPCTHRAETDGEQPPAWPSVRQEVARVGGCTGHIATDDSAAQPLRGGVTRRIAVLDGGGGDVQQIGETLWVSSFATDEVQRISLAS
jgi:hypothetical protein